MDDVKCAGLTAAAPDVMDAALAVVRDSGRSGFPFGMPVSIERERHLPLLRARQYWITPKVSGTRVAIVCSSRGPVLVDRARETFALPLKGPAFLAKGTIMDAELAQEQATGQWHLLVFDVAMLAGKLVEDHLGKRLEALSKLCPLMACPQVAILAKPMLPVAPGCAHAVAALLPSFANDGVIFTPEAEGPSKNGMAPYILKLKRVHTLDMQWTDGPPDECMWFGDAADMVSARSLRPEVVMEGVPVPGPSTPVVAEVAIVHVDRTRLHLKFVCTRPKKVYANNALCVIRTLVSAQDAVTLEEVDAALEGEEAPPASSAP